MSMESTKPFERPWFIANWVAFAIGLVIPVAYAAHHRGGTLSHHTLTVLGLSLASISAHAVYGGYFAVRDAVYTREDDPGMFWFGVVAFSLISLLILGR
ncbi:hypothetical protein CJO96_07880 [Ralstonia solanacearum]|nr:hypothetical protein CJO89_07890 [Ralstonia solanacearum]AXW71080.1 hypothetical protein CJO96_07880 [Ralstonia solanacearum]